MATHENEPPTENAIDVDRIERASIHSVAAHRSPSPDPLSSTSLLATSSAESPKPEQNKPNPPLAQISSHSRSLVPIFLVAGYAILSIFSWVTTCIMTQRPLWPSKYTDQYVCDYHQNPDRCTGSSAETRENIAKNRDWYQGIRALQSVIAVLTLPLATAVLSAATVIYVQRTTHNLSLRKLIVLADKGWTDIITMFQAFCKSRDAGFLKIAFAVYVLGGLLSPLQEYLLIVEPIKVTYYQETAAWVKDIPALIQHHDIRYINDNLIVLITRELLETTSSSQPQAQLWQGSGYACSDTQDNNGELLSETCRIGTTLGEIASLKDPFLAQLPAGYSTGLIRQFLPRINSTAEVSLLSVDEFPRSCNTSSGSFWASYYSAGGGTADPMAAPVSLQACMPGNLTASPWKPTRDLQSFTEELYLNITFEYDPDPKNTCMKIQVNTTAGYFELPNNWNQTAGELLQNDPYGPGGACDKGCIRSFQNDYTQNNSSDENDYIEEYVFSFSSVRMYEA